MYAIELEHMPVINGDPVVRVGAQNMLGDKEKLTEYYVCTSGTSYWRRPDGRWSGAGGFFANSDEEFLRKRLGASSFMKKTFSLGRVMCPEHVNAYYVNYGTDGEPKAEELEYYITRRGIYLNIRRKGDALINVSVEYYGRQEACKPYILWGKEWQRKLYCAYTEAERDVDEEELKEILQRYFTVANW